MDVHTDRLIAQLRFRQLALICSLAQTRSLRLTAERLHLTPPAVSSNIIECEKLLGFALFERLPQGMRLTDAGREFVAIAKNILSEIAYASSVGKTSEGQVHWALRLGTATYIGAYVLPRLVSDLRAEFVALRIRHEDKRVLALIEQLHTGDLDMIIIVGTEAMLAGLDHPSLVSSDLFEEKFIVVAAPARAQRLGPRPGWAELAAEPWILPPPGVLQRQMLDAAMANEGLVQVDPAIETASQLGAIQLAAADIGLTALPMTVVAPALESGALQDCNVSPGLPHARVKLAYRASLSSRSGFDKVRQAIVNSLGRPSDRAVGGPGA